MARRCRLHVPGGIYHVMLRGNNGQKIFFSDTDRCYLSILIQHATFRYDCLVHGFCFMDNHIHLIIQVKEISLSKIMQNIAFRYTRWINRTYKRTGHIFQARFNAIFVDNQSYLLQLLRYVHLNPVSAGIVKSAIDYRWSGHATYLGLDNFLWLTTDYMLSQFSLNQPRQAYAEFIETFSPDNISEINFTEQKITEIEIEQNIVSQLTFEDILKFVYQHYCFTTQNIINIENQKVDLKTKAIIAWLSVEFNIRSMTQVSQYFDCKLPSISRKLRSLYNTNFEELNFLKNKIIELC